MKPIVAGLFVAIGLSAVLPGCGTTETAPDCQVISSPTAIGTSLIATMLVRSGRPCGVTVTPSSGTPVLSRQPANGTLRTASAPRSVVIYTSRPGYVGTDSFEFAGPGGGPTLINVEVLPALPRERADKQVAPSPAASPEKEPKGGK